MEGQPVRQTVTASAVWRFCEKIPTQAVRKIRNKSFETKYEKSLETIGKVYNKYKNRHYLW